VSVALSGTLLLLFSGMAGAETLVTTGPGGTSSIGSSSLFGTGSQTCSPQPACSASFQFLAGQFTLPSGATLDSVEGWMGPGGSGGSLAVKILTDCQRSPEIPPGAII
jgi:hypothetical protein